MIRVFINYAAADESPIVVHEDADDFKVGAAGELVVVSVEVDNDAFGFKRKITYAPGTWRWVEDGD